MFTVGVLLVVAGAWLFPQEHVLASGSDGLRAVQAELVAKITTFLLSHDGPSEKRNRYAGTGWRRDAHVRGPPYERIGRPRQDQDEHPWHDRGGVVAS